MLSLVHRLSRFSNLFLRLLILFHLLFQSLHIGSRVDGFLRFGTEVDLRLLLGMRFSCDGLLIYRSIKAIEARNMTTITIAQCLKPTPSGLGYSALGKSSQTS